jgi:Phospholipase_D-nuclease N-terminal
VNSLADLLWAMVAFYFLFMILWIFIRIFADIFRRQDLSGARKAIWVVILLALPFLGAIIYLIGRPTLAHEGWVAEVASPQPAGSMSAAAEVTKLAASRDAGALTPAGFGAAKAQALA